MFNVFKVKNHQNYSNKTIQKLAETCPRRLYDTLIDNLYFRGTDTSGKARSGEYPILSPRRMAAIKRKETPFAELKIETIIEKKANE